MSLPRAVACVLAMPTGRAAMGRHVDVPGSKRSAVAERAANRPHAAFGAGRAQELPSAEHPDLRAVPDGSGPGAGRQRQVGQRVHPLSSRAPAVSTSSRPGSVSPSSDGTSTAVATATTYPTRRPRGDAGPVAGGTPPRAPPDRRRRQCPRAPLGGAGPGSRPRHSSWVPRRLVVADQPQCPAGPPACPRRRLFTVPGAMPSMVAISSSLRSS